MTLACPVCRSAHIELSEERQPHVGRQETGTAFCWRHMVSIQCRSAVSCPGRLRQQCIQLPMEPACKSTRPYEERGKTSKQQYAPMSRCENLSVAWSQGRHHSPLVSCIVRRSFFEARRKTLPKMANAGEKQNESNLDRKFDQKIKAKANFCRRIF